jgi:hypothetical protein
MMDFSVPISLQIPLKLPHVCLMENSPFLENGDAMHHLHSNTGICFWWRFKLCCQMYEQNGRVIGRHIWCLHQTCCPISSLLTVTDTSMKFQQCIPEHWWYLIDVVEGLTLVLIIKS